MRHLHPYRTLLSLPSHQPQICPNAVTRSFCCAAIYVFGLPGFKVWAFFWRYPEKASTNWIGPRSVVRGFRKPWVPPLFRLKGYCSIGGHLLFRVPKASRGQGLWAPSGVCADVSSLPVACPCRRTRNDKLGCSRHVLKRGSETLKTTLALQLSGATCTLSLSLSLSN